MFRFTIRELVLLTLVVAMGVGWKVERSMALRGAEGRERQWRKLTINLAERLNRTIPTSFKLTMPDGKVFNFIHGNPNDGAPVPDYSVIQESSDVHALPHPNPADRAGRRDCIAPGCCGRDCRC